MGVADQALAILAKVAAERDDEAGDMAARAFYEIGLERDEIVLTVLGRTTRQLADVVIAYVGPCPFSDLLQQEADRCDSQRRLARELHP